MKIEREDAGLLRLSKSQGAYRVLLLLLAGGAIVSWLMGWFPAEDWRAQVGLALAVGAPLLFALWLQDSVWTFDRGRQVVTWTRSRLVGRECGTLPFARVQGVAIRTGTNYEDYAKDPHAYRVVLAVSDGDLPLSQWYGGREEAQRVAAAVREALA
jgi:hypothetical protein